MKKPYQIEAQRAIMLAIIEKRRNLDVWPACASSGRNLCGAEARRMG